MESSLAPAFPKPQGRALGKTGTPRRCPQTEAEWERGITAGDGPLLAGFPRGKLSEGL